MRNLKNLGVIRVREGYDLEDQNQNYLETFLELPLSTACLQGLTSFFLDSVEENRKEKARIAI